MLLAIGKMRNKNPPSFNAQEYKSYFVDTREAQT
jgi:hypothetical protein